MANVIKVKQSSVASKVPATTDLALGELAINTTDGKLYFKKNVSGTESIVDVLAAGVASNVSGVVAIANGGTNATSAGAALTSLGAYAATNPSGYTANVGTVTSVAALTLGTAGTNVGSSVAGGTVTPVITLNIPTASAANRGALSAADWSTFNAKQAAGTYATGTGSASGVNTGDNAANTLYSGLVSNATHTGDVTGSTALTLASIIIAGGPIGSTSVVPVITYDDHGRLTAVTSATITPASIGAQVAGSYQAAGTYATGTGTASGTNTGDETTATIKTKLSITTLSGSNTGDQTLPTTLPASDVYAWAKAATKPSYAASEVGLGSVNNTADAAKSVSYAATAGSAPANGGTSTATYHMQQNGGTTSNWNTHFTETAASNTSWTEASSGGPAGTWWFIEHMRHSNASNQWGKQYAHGWEDNANRLAMRNVSGGSWSGWVEFITSANFSSYVTTGPTGATGSAGATGATGATGAAGSAASVTSANVFSAINGQSNGDWYRTSGATGWYNSTYAVGVYATEAGNVRTYNGASFIAAGNVTAYSDERVKTNWRGLPENFLHSLAELKMGIYDRTDQVLTQVGVSAQALQKFLPEAIVSHGEGELSVAYGNAALAACVMLAREIETMKARFVALENQQ